MLFQKVLRTNNDTAPFVLRLVLAIVIFPHGAQKLIGWFGGNGLNGTLGWFTEGLGVPWILAFLVIVAEFFGSLALAVGFLSRIAAAGIGCVMTGAVLLVHLQNGFFMNWQGTKSGEGFEYHLLALAIVVSLLITGGGRWSIDGFLNRKRSPE